LITGGGGFLAGALANELKQRKSGKIHLLCRGAAAGDMRGDLLDPEATNLILKAVSPSTIYHLAGTTRPLPWNGLWDAHVRTTLNLLNAVCLLPRREKVTIVISGSAAEYGSGGAPGPVLETSPTTPLSVYGATKLSQSIAALSYVPLGLDIRIARIFNVVGPGMPDRQALGAFARQVSAIQRGRQSSELSVGDLRPQRDLIDVRDVASGLADVARCGKAGEVYNICSGKPVSMRWMLDRLLALAGLKAAVRQGAVRPNSGVARIYGSRKKLTRLSGWRPIIPLETSLQDTLAWCHNQS
jgi:GDP-4-dehydro-6-deoxy-D-mannose reductase